MSRTWQFRDDFDVVTATFDGGVIWKRLRDGKIVVTTADQTPQEVLAKEPESSVGGGGT